jgi:DNA modification methylase
MKPYYQDSSVTIWHGDCREVLRTLEADSLDACVTDPPYGLGFMGKGWDKFKGGDIAMRRNPKMDSVNTGASRQGGRQRACADYQKRQASDMRAFQEWCEAWAVEIFRVLKPGAHLLAFGGTRTYHRMVCAIEDAGFEIRDQIGWLYGSGFPKSLDVSKAIDKAAGAERKVTGRRKDGVSSPGISTKRDAKNEGIWIQEFNETEPATNAAKEWDGWGTALKPAWEPIVVARKSLTGTVAENVQRFGTGAMNVNACRVACDPEADARDMGRVINRNVRRPDGWGMNDKEADRPSVVKPEGRWPANIVHDGSDEVLSEFAKSGEKTSGAMKREVAGYDGESMFFNGRSGPSNQHGGSGTAARFFYCAKASSDERRGDHPTVKPLALMQWLVTLVVPSGGTVVDPFSGSGSTLAAAKCLGFKAIGVEREESYCQTAVKRLEQEVLLFREACQT